MRYIICLCCLSMLIQGCQNHVENKPIPQNAQVVKDTPSNKGNEKATIDTKAFGDKVLKGLVTVSDDELTFACMDSLTSNNAQTRSFYWEVFKVILKQSDGALSEVVGANAYAFLQKYPLDFIQKYNSLNKELKDKTIFFLSYEDYAEDNPDFRKDFFTSVIKSCSDCSEQDIRSLKTLEKDIIKSVKSMKE